MDKQEWIQKIKDWIIADTDDGKTDMVTLDADKSGLTYHEVWRICEESGYKQADLSIDNDDNVESVTFLKKKKDAFQLVLEVKNECGIISFWLAKYYY